MAQLAREAAAFPPGRGARPLLESAHPEAPGREYPRWIRETPHFLPSWPGHAGLRVE